MMHFICVSLFQQFPRKIESRFVALENMSSWKKQQAEMCVFLGRPSVSEKTRGFSSFQFDRFYRHKGEAIAFSNHDAHSHFSIIFHFHKIIYLYSWNAVHNSMYNNKCNEWILIFLSYFSWIIIIQQKSNEKKE